MAYDWNFAALLIGAPAFVRGLLCTIELSVVASILGTSAGLGLAIVCHGRLALKHAVQRTFEAVRSVPILVLMFFFYYFPYRELGTPPPSAFTSAVLALALSQSAHSFQIILAALAHVPYEHTLGLKGLGFSRQQIARHAVLPWVLRETLPGHMSLWVSNVLQSSLASTIGVEEIVYAAKMIASQSFRSLESWIVVAAIYLLLIIPLNVAQRSLEFRYRRYRKES